MLGEGLRREQPLTGLVWVGAIRLKRLVLKLSFELVIVDDDELDLLTVLADLDIERHAIERLRKIVGNDNHDLALVLDDVVALFELGKRQAEAAILLEVEKNRFALA